jgi:hypothetical protein
VPTAGRRAGLGATDFVGREGFSLSALRGGLPDLSSASVQGCKPWMISRGIWLTPPPP